jgi:zinc D-Ala-D-Ala dipeptidase
MTWLNATATSLLSAFLFGCTSPAPQSTKSPVSGALQAIVVTTVGWDSTAGTAACFTRTETNKSWQPAGISFPVVVGRSGLGWGAGLHSANKTAVPRKREGDGRAPAGVFRLGHAFGHAAADEMKWARLPYVQYTSEFQCIDDSRSVFYNSMVQTSLVARVDWTSAEEMRRADDFYRLGILVEHNTDPRVAGAGSCIFIHIWRGPGTFTSGCTAADDDIERLLTWLRPDSRPVLIQLPQIEYQRLEKRWELPKLNEREDAR